MAYERVQPTYLVHLLSFLNSSARETRYILSAVGRLTPGDGKQHVAVFYDPKKSAVK